MTVSLCADCANNFVFQMGAPLLTFLDSLPAPVFVVDDDVVVKAANAKGCALLGKKPDEVREKFGGTVFECAYAQLPAGCGRTVHCSACAVRRSVHYTHETGKPLSAVPATLKWCREQTEQDIVLHISTEKMGDVVLLRIDNLSAPQRA